MRFHSSHIDAQKYYMSMDMLYCSELPLLSLIRITLTSLSFIYHSHRYLGATERATPDQFAAVLDRLYYENQGM